MPFTLIKAASPDASDTLIIATNDYFYKDTYNLKYVMQSLFDPSQIEELSFDIYIIGDSSSSCTKRWRYPPAPYSFDRIYVKGSDELTIEFYEVDVSNCQF